MQKALYSQIYCVVSATLMYLALMLTGRRVVRTQLPGGAGRPSCTSSFILVPLRKQPKICVLDWTGKILQILDHTQLGLKDDDWGWQVSPVQDGRFSFFVTADEGPQIITYEVTNTSPAQSSPITVWTSAEWATLIPGNTYTNDKVHSWMERSL